VHIVDNPQNQINEAFRVLRTGSAACFTIWGQKSECLAFSLIETVLQKYTTPEQKEIIAKTKSHFDLYADKGARMRQMLEASGFKDVKIWE